MADVQNPTSNYERNDWYSDSDAAKTRYTGNYKASDGKEYTLWLVGAVLTITPAYGNFIAPLKGHDVIDNNNNEWGVTWRTFFESSFSGFLMSSKENPYHLQGPSSQSYSDVTSGNFFTLQKGPLSPGFIGLPVCTVGLALQNLLHFSNKGAGNLCEVFPCCAVDWQIDPQDPSFLVERDAFFVGL
jgi:hypothetical protein